MKKFILGLTGACYAGVLMFMWVVPAIAETQESVKSNVMSFTKKKAVEEVVIPEDTEEPVVGSVATPAVSTKTSEAQTKLQAIKTQEQWVAKLTKQLEGETNQLKEMRESYAQAFGKESK